MADELLYFLFSANRPYSNSIFDAFLYMSFLSEPFKKHIKHNPLLFTPCLPAHVL